MAGSQGSAHRAALWNVATPWTALLNSSATHGPGLERLLAIYREPVYAYFRAQGLKHVDAEDLTQQLLMDFFLVRASHKTAHRERGRFRYFLQSSARNALLDWTKQNRTLKRGGRAAHVSLDHLLTTPMADLQAPRGEDPEAYFDRNWAQATWRAAYERFRVAASSQLVEAFELFYAASHKGSHEAAAKSLGISLPAFNSRLFSARKKFHECIKEVVSATLDEPGELKQELDFLLELLSKHGFS